MNGRIILSAASILASVAVVAGATFAFFSDEASSNDNTFNAGTLDMQLSNNNSTFAQNVSSTWGLNSAPGDTFDQTLYIKNTGSVPANHVELKFTNTATESASLPGSVSTTPMDKVIEITALGWDSDGNGSTDVDLLPSVSNVNGNGIIDLDDLENQVADDFDNLSFLGTQTDGHALRIAGRLSPTLATNEHQGDGVDMDLAVTMNQDSSQ